MRNGLFGSSASPIQNAASGLAGRNSSYRKLPEAYDLAVERELLAQNGGLGEVDYGQGPRYMGGNSPQLPEAYDLAVAREAAANDNTGIVNAIDDVVAGNNMYKSGGSNPVPMEGGRTNNNFMRHLSSGDFDFQTNDVYSANKPKKTTKKRRPANTKSLNAGTQYGMAPVDNSDIVDAVDAVVNSKRKPSKKQRAVANAAAPQIIEKRAGDPKQSYAQQVAAAPMNQHQRNLQLLDPDYNAGDGFGYEY